jgi:hypothetical protein
MKIQSTILKTAITFGLLSMTIGTSQAALERSVSNSFKVDVGVVSGAPEFVLPSIGHNNVEAGSVHSGLSIDTATSVNFSDTATYKLSLSGYTTGTIYTDDGTKHDGAAMLDSNGTVGAINAFWVINSTVDAAPTSVKQLEGCNVSYITPITAPATTTTLPAVTASGAVGDDAAVSFGTNTFCKLELSGLYLNGINSQTQGSVIAIDAFAPNTNYETTFDATVEPI